MAGIFRGGTVRTARVLRAINRRFSTVLWLWVTRRELGRTKKLRRQFAAERRRLQAEIDDLAERLKRHEADSAWEKQRLEGQIAILNEERVKLLDVIQRDRQRVAAEIAVLARRESEARFGATGGGVISSE